MEIRTNPITINEAFICQNCGKKVPKAAKTCRNHCNECLYSLHVDLETPGDRASECGGLMKPIKLEISRKKGYIITHKCQICGAEKRNKSLDDDNFELLTKLLKKTNESQL